MQVQDEEDASAALPCVGCPVPSASSTSSQHPGQQGFELFSLINLSLELLLCSCGQEEKGTDS